MKPLRLQKRTIAVLAFVLPLALLLIWVALRSGPLAPVAVTLGTAERGALVPALYGIGTVEARYVHRIGPTVPGRLLRLDVHVGDTVRSGQVLGEMDPVDLQARSEAQSAAIARAEASVREAAAREKFAATQAQRYARLGAEQLVSAESVADKRQGAETASAALAAARGDLARARADFSAIGALRGNLQLIAPVDGIVAARDADPGSTLVAGQTVVEVIEPGSLWINARFDQTRADGLAAGLPATITLRSRSRRSTTGTVLRIEPLADAITEELLAKVRFAAMPQPLPPLGELAEVTVQLPARAASVLIPNAAIQRQGDQLGVWRVNAAGRPEFVPVTLGAGDLDGRVEVLDGLAAGTRIVVYSERPLGANSRLRVLERIPGTTR